MSLVGWLQRLRVPMGWAFAAAFFLWARPTPAAILAGAALFVAGAAIRTWAAGHIRKRESLAVTGPYAHTRNPLYFGSFLMACGALVMGRNLWLAAAFAAVAVPVYAATIREEETLLAGLFGEAFAAYSREVPRFLPRLFAPAGARGAFDWELVRTHREWRVWVGGAALTLALLARWLWSRSP